MKDQILKLRNEGKSYSQICQELNCSKSTVSYYCGQDQKEKNIQRGLKWKEKNPLKVKLDNAKTHHRTSLRRKVKDYKRRVSYGKAPLVNSDISSFKEVEKLFMENPICYLTGRKIDLKKSSSYHIDHFIPTSKGGDNSITNLRLTCKEANKAKDDLLFEDFLQLCKEILLHNGFEVKRSGGL